MTSENPFSPDVERSAFLETVEGGEVLRRLDAGLGAREPFLLLTGESGVGKTALVHEAMARWDARVSAAFLAYPPANAKDLLEDLVLRFGGSLDGASRPMLMACLERSLADIAERGRTAMIVVDAAHRWTPECLDELSLLVNAVQQSRGSLEILLIGSPELETLLENPALAALRERLSVHAKLAALSPGETRRYLRHRVSVAGLDGATLFPRKICLEIAASTAGLPRRINLVAGEALRLAREAEARSVGDEHLRAAMDALAGKIPARDADEPDEEECAPSPNSKDVVSKAPARTTRSTADVAPIAAGRASAGSRPEWPAAEEADGPVAPTRHDPDEWVARFVGDQGPIRIGSQVMAATAFTTEPESRHEPRPAEAAHRTRDETGSAPTTARLAPTRATKRNDTLLVTYALVAIAFIGVAILLLRTGLLTSGKQPPVVAQTPTPVARPPVVAASAPRRVVRVDEPSPAAASDSAGADRPEPSPTGRWTLAVGEFRDLEAAFDERDRIHVLTGMDTWVVPAANESGPHRIVLGIYRSAERAQGVAKMLIDSRTLDVATVVPLPKRSHRL